MPEIPASSPRHIVHGTAAAFTTSAGVPTSFKYLYGTWSSPDAAGNYLALYGVIANYTLTKLGDISNLKDGGGSTFAHVIVDPGWKITASILHAVTDPNYSSPRQGGRILFRRMVDVTPQPVRAFSAVVSGTGAKARFTIASTTGYAVGELVTVTGTYVGTYPVLSIDSATTITLDTPFGVTSAGSLSAPLSTVALSLKAVVTAVSVKWEREGWRMLEIEAEARDSINLGVTYGAYINELGAVGTIVYDGT